MPWPTIEIFLLFILDAMLQIKELDYYQPTYSPLLLYFSFTPSVVLQPHHGSVFFPVYVWLPSIDLIHKRAHVTLEILKLQNVAFRHCLFGRAPFVLHIQ